MFGRRRPLDPRAREALAGAVAAPLFELIPIASADEGARLLPTGAAVSVTASPAKGMDATIAVAERLAAQGFDVTPHLAAHMVRDRAHLAGIMRRCEDAGIKRAFVVGGDAREPGEFRDGLALLRAMTDAGHPFVDLGIPCYPQGHPLISDGRLLESLRQKGPFVQSMTSQMCFDPDAIERWVRARRAEGIELPLVVGIPGVTDPRRLLTIATRIGVTDTRTFVRKNRRIVLRLVRSGGFYRPDGLLRALAPLFADPAACIAGIHLYTFNQVATTEAWRRPWVEALRADTAVVA